MNETGGPAFPHTVEYKGADCGGVVPHGGMTLRDYFAAKAMAAVIINSDHNSTVIGEVEDWVGNYAYACADAMLEARQE